MKKAISLLGTALIYFCVATVIALVAALSTLWIKGALDPSRMYRVLAALHGIDVITMQTQITARRVSADDEQPSYETRIELGALKSLDIDLRETALDKGRLDMLNRQTALETDQKRFEDLKRSWDKRLEEITDEEQATSMQELQRILEAMKPPQAKEQIVKMCDDDAIDDAVAVLKKMSMDKQKKIFAEFKQGPETELLYEILTMIRTGEPITSQIQDTRDKLKQFDQTQ